MNQIVLIKRLTHCTKALRCRLTACSKDFHLYLQEEKDKIMDLSVITRKELALWSMSSKGHIFRVLL